jgi:hypothetical protein
LCVQAEVRDYTRLVTFEAMILHSFIKKSIGSYSFKKKKFKLFGAMIVAFKLAHKPISGGSIILLSAFTSQMSLLRNGAREILKIKSKTALTKLFGLKNLWYFYNHLPGHIGKFIADNAGRIVGFSTP